MRYRRQFFFPSCMRVEKDEYIGISVSPRRCEALSLSAICRNVPDHFLQTLPVGVCFHLHVSAQLRKRKASSGGGGSLGRVPGDNVKRKRAAASTSDDPEATPNTDPGLAQNGADATDKGGAAAEHEQVRDCVNITFFLCCYCQQSRQDGRSAGVYLLFVAGAGHSLVKS